MSYLYSKFYMPLSKMYRVSPKKFTLDFLEILRHDNLFLQKSLFISAKISYINFLVGPCKGTSLEPLSDQL